MFGKIIFKIYFKFELFCIRKILKRLNYNKKYDVSNFNKNVIFLDFSLSKSGLIHYFDTECVKKVTDLDLFCLVRFCSGIIRGPILNCCPGGIISFHHGDNSINRGGPPGFWEVYLRQKATGFTIQKLSDELDGGEVLYKGYIATCWLSSLNMIRIYYISILYMNLIIDRMISSSIGLEKINTNPIIISCINIQTFLISSIIFL